MASPAPSRRRVAQYLASELANGAAPRIVAQRAAAYAVTSKTTRQADQLIEDIAEALRVQTGHVAATVRSAHSIDEATKAKIREFISKEWSATTIEIHEAIDPSLLGGVVIEAGGSVYDASLRNRLSTITKRLAHSDPETTSIRKTSTTA